MNAKITQVRVITTRFNAGRKAAVADLKRDADCMPNWNMLAADGQFRAGYLEVWEEYQDSPYKDTYLALSELYFASL